MSLLSKSPLQLNADELSAIVPSDIKSYELIACKIGDYLKQVQPKELWIEWNGMVSFHQLEALLYSDMLRHLVQIERYYIFVPINLFQPYSLVSVMI